MAHVSDRRGLTGLATLFAAFLLLCSCDDGAPAAQSGVATQTQSSPIARIQAPASADEDSSFSIDGRSSSDPDGGVMRYVWSLTAPSELQATLENADQSVAQVTVGEIAQDVSLILSLTVFDATGAENTAQHTVNIREIHFAQLPPDPGAASLSALEGIDVDNDGVRDDVERGIYQLYPLDKFMRQVMNYGAKGLQLALLAGDAQSDTDSDFAAMELAKWAACLVEMQVNGNYDITFAAKEMSKIDVLQFNTDERIAALGKYEMLRSGTVVPAVDVSVDDCNID